MMALLYLLTCILSSSTGTSLSDTIFHRLEEQKWQFPQEKISVSTGHDEYAAGDTIQMNIQVVNASTLQPSGLSRFAYVELTNPFGELCKRVKIKLSDSKATGYVALSPELAEGIYTLTAYTRFMENNGADYFFSKQLYIYGNRRPKTTPTFTYIQNGKNLSLNINIGNDGNPATVELSTPNAKSHTSVRKKKNHTFELKHDEWTKGVALVKIDNYSLFVALPPDSLNIHATVRPEGGCLIPNIINIVGIRIFDNCGRGMKLIGKVVDEQGDSVYRVETDSNGYGRILFVPTPQSEYKIVAGGSSFPIPPAHENTATLKVNSFRNKSLSIAPTGIVPDNSILLIHCRGNLIYCGEVTNNSYTFDKEQLLPGINEILLLDSNLNTLSQRKVFIVPQNIDTDERRILLDLDIPRFSTQNASFQPKFNDNASRVAIDNIMLASDCWQRYDIPSVIKGEYKTPTADLEIGMEITGTVKSRWKGKPLGNAEVSIISSDISYGNTIRTDKDGRFVFNGIDWPEGTRFALKATNANGEPEENFTIEEEEYPVVNHIVPSFTNSHHPIKETADMHINDRLSKWLDEVEVTATAKPTEDDEITQIYEIAGGRTIDQSYFERRAVTSYEMAITAFPSLIVQNGRVLNQGKEVELWIDGVKWEPAYEPTKSTHELGLDATRKNVEQSKANLMTGGLLPEDIALSQYASLQSPLSDFASSYPFHIVDKIIYLRPSAALIVGNHAAYNGGALMIFTKRKNTTKSVDYYRNLKVISPLGYQK